MTLTLKDYQHMAIDFALKTPKCAIWADMGLGKTVLTLTALNTLHNTCEVAKTLVVGPVNVVKRTWPDEMEKWHEEFNLDYVVITGGPEKRKQLLELESDVYFINRELIFWLVDHYKQKWPFDCVVIDESSSFKSTKTKRFRALKKVSKYIDRMIQLTGTPASNGLLDLYAQIYLLDGGDRLGRTVTAYKETYFKSDFKGWAWTPKDGVEGVIHDSIADLVLRIDANDYLPSIGRINNELSVELSPKLRKDYKQLEKEFVLELYEANIKAQNAATVGVKLRQLCNGFVYDHNQDAIELHDAKLTALESVIEEANGKPVLVAYAFKQDWSAIEKKFPHAKNVKELKTYDAWNRGEIPLLCAHPASAGHGLNLQYGGNIIVWFGLTWSLELYDQFNARLDRQGQKNTVFVHHIVVKDSVEEDVEQALINKRSVQSALLDAVKKR